jgi:outer membrane protein assembly factor BamB
VAGFGVLKGDQLREEPMRPLFSWTLKATVLATIVASLGCSGPVEKLWQYRSHSASYSSPAVGNNIIVFGTTSGELHALSRDGAFLWKFQTRKEIVSAPQVMENLIFFGSTNHNLYAVDLKGRQVWKYTTFDRIKGDVLVDPPTKTVFVGSYDKHLYALDAVSRAERWTFPPQNEDEKEEEKPEEEKPEGEEGAETPEEPKVDTSQWPTNSFAYAQPTLIEGGLLVMGNLDGHLYAVDAKNGELRWRWNPGQPIRGGITSTVVEKDGVLYFGGNDNKVYAIKAADQSKVWEFETAGEINSSAVIAADGTLYIGSRDKKLYALDSGNGSKKWEFTADGPVLARPALYQEKLLIVGAGEGDGHIYAIDARNGKVFWKYKTEDKVEADAYVDGDRFYIASGDKNLYAFKINKLPGA